MSAEHAPAVCTNCGALLAGEFCHACGQKRFVESDRRFTHLLREFVAGATELDGRVWRTLRALLFQPGLLSRDYNAGRRAHWLAPITLFLAVNVVYFIAPLHGDLALQFNQQVSGRIRALASEPGPNGARTESEFPSNGQLHSSITSAWVDAKVRELAARHPGYGYRDLRIAYDAKADDVSKALIILHVPFTALALMLMFAYQRRYFAEHFVVALHFFAFALISLQVAVQTQALMQFALPAWAPPDGVLDIVMRIVFPTYAILSLRRAYALGWPAAIAGGIGMLAAILAINLYIYRTVQFVVTFALAARG